jgi:hypothetical protein
MRKRLYCLLLAVAFALPSSSCYTIRHDVGAGADQGVEVAQERQWYALFGLVRMNEVDGGELADGRTNYTIETQRSATDVLISLITLWVTIFPKTATVTE